MLLILFRLLSLFKLAVCYMSTEQEVDSNGRELVGQEAGAIAVQRA